MYDIVESITPAHTGESGLSGHGRIEPAILTSLKIPNCPCKRIMSNVGELLLKPKLSILDGPQLAADLLISILRFSKGITIISAIPS